VEVILRRPLPQPQDGRQYVLVEGYWIQKGPLELPKEDSNDYILTTSVRANLRDLARIVSAG
jgi:midasin